MSDVKNVYGAFLTDQSAETAGTWIDYGAVQVKIARSGGANKSFARLLESKTKPYQRAIKTDTMDNSVAERIMREVFAEAVVLGWKTKLGEEWKDVVLFKDGSTAPFTKQSVMRVFEEIPDLFQDIQDQAGKASNFREAQREGNAGN